MLSEEQIERFSRHILLKEVGGAGQEKLLASKVLIVGAGGLGSPAALYLTAAGVGEIGLCDFDEVSLSNLQRQVLYDTADVGKPKTRCAAARLRGLWPGVKLNLHDEKLTPENARPLIRDYDLVLEGSDNFETKFLVSDAAVLEDKPAVIGGILRWHGQVLSVVPGKACYRCLFERPPPPGTTPTCAQAGVIGALAGLVGSIQAAEAIKLLLGIGEPLQSRLLTIEALEATFREVPLGRREGCETCGPQASVRLPG